MTSAGSVTIIYFNHQLTTLLCLERPVLKSRASQLTECERANQVVELRTLLSGDHPLDKREAVAALEAAARLLEDAAGMQFPAELREQLLPVVEQASGLAIRDDGLKETAIVAEGNSVRAVPLILGVYLNVSQDFSLLSVTVFPGELQEWKKWMSVVGIAGDAELANDVAERHDHYSTEVMETSGEEIPNP